MHNRYMVLPGCALLYNAHNMYRYHPNFDIPSRRLCNNNLYSFGSETRIDLVDSFSFTSNGEGDVSPSDSPSNVIDDITDHMCFQKEIKEPNTNPPADA